MMEFGKSKESRDAALGALVSEPSTEARKQYLYPIWEAGGFHTKLSELDTPGAAAARTLNSNLTPQLVDKLLELLEDPEYSMNASRALNGSTSPKVRDRAAKLAFDPEVDEMVRAWALPLAMEYDFDQHRGALWNALLDPSEAASVRGYACSMLRGNLEPVEITELVERCSKILEQNDSLNDEQALQLQFMLGTLKGVGTSDVVDLMRSAYLHRADKTNVHHEVDLNGTELMAADHLANLSGEARSFFLETILSPRMLSYPTAVDIKKLVVTSFANSEDEEVYDALNSLRSANETIMGSIRRKVAWQHDHLCEAMVAVSPAKQWKVLTLQYKLSRTFSEPKYYW